jgi:hypothetical protein
VSNNEPFYRCRVAAELAAGKLRVGWHRLDVLVDEKSIDGYTIRIKPQDLAKIKFQRKAWVLEHFEERSEVHPEWFLNHSGESIQMGLRRLADVTPLPHAELSPLRCIFSVRALLRRVLGTPELLLGGAALILLMLLTLPGFGDQLGTAPRIRNGSILLMKLADGALRSIFR